MKKNIYIYIYIYKTYNQITLLYTKNKYGIVS